LVGEAKLSLDSRQAGRLLAAAASAALPGANDWDIAPVAFVPQAGELPRQTELGFVVDAESVLGALR